MFKFYKGLLPSIMDNVFRLKTDNPYNLRQAYEFSRPIVKTVYHGSESISYLGPKIWDMLSENLANMENLETFKKEIKIWEPYNCPYRLCKVYIESVGFLQKLLISEIRRNIKFLFEIFVLLKYRVIDC